MAFIRFKIKREMVESEEVQDGTEGRELQPDAQIKKLDRFGSRKSGAPFVVRGKSSQMKTKRLVGAQENMNTTVARSSAEIKARLA